MSRIRDRTHAETLTREAAAAIGRDVPEGARWDALLGGLQLAPATLYCRNTFAPLNSMADAYEIETVLKMDVSYKDAGTGSRLLQMQLDGASMFQILSGDQQADLRARMELAVIMASVIGTMRGVNSG